MSYHRLQETLGLRVKLLAGYAKPIVRCQQDCEGCLGGDPQNARINSTEGRVDTAGGRNEGSSLHAGESEGLLLPQFHLLPSSNEILHHAACSQQVISPPVGSNDYLEVVRFSTSCIMDGIDNFLLRLRELPNSCDALGGLMRSRGASFTPAFAIT
ncbi:hypothetical protein TSMEX_000538 [Taenia solium]|eukprot:TsM_000877200 transcript=TsM_000877200 gene=TsM_000877200